MSKYQILRFDSVLYTGTTNIPMIYIKPDIYFLEFIKANYYMVICEISGTGTEYDGRKIAGKVNRSEIDPSLYVISLNVNFIIYPEKLGFVEFSGLEKPLKPIKENYEFSTNIQKEENLTVIVGLSIVILLLIFILLR